MGDSPAGNGDKRFEDMVARVNRMDGKLDQHSETLAEIRALLGGRPCVAHDDRLRAVERDTGVLMGGAQVSVAKVGGISGIIAAAVAALGYWLMAKGS